LVSSLLDLPLQSHTAVMTVITAASIVAVCLAFIAVIATTFME